MSNYNTVVKVVIAALAVLCVVLLFVYITGTLNGERSALPEEVVDAGAAAETGDASIIDGAANDPGDDLGADGNAAGEPTEPVSGADA